MGSKISSLSGISKARARNVGLGLVLLWRPVLIALARGRAKAIARSTLERLSLLSVLMASSQSPVWASIRKITGLSHNLQKAIILAVLQGFGDIVPTIALLFHLCGSVVAKLEKSEHVYIRLFFFPALITASFMLLTHEMPFVFNTGYLSLLRNMTGPSVPVLGLHATYAPYLHRKPHASAAQTEPLSVHSDAQRQVITLTSPRGAASPRKESTSGSDSTIHPMGDIWFALRWRPLFTHFVRTFRFMSKWFLMLYLLIKPALRMQLPQLISVLKAIRSAFMVSLGGLVVFFMGRWQIEGEPVKTAIIRSIVSGVGSLFHLIEARPEAQPIVSVMAANALFGYVNFFALLMRRFTGVNLHLERSLSIALPVLAVYKLVKPSPVTRVVLSVL